MAVRLGLIAMCVVVASAGPLRADDDLAAAYAKVQEIYGDRIATVQATDDDDDNRSLVESMLAAVEDTGQEATFRFALADTAVGVAGEVGLPRTFSLAQKAMKLAAAIRPYPPVLEARRQMELSQWRLDRLTADGADRWAKAPIARMLASAQLQFINSAAATGEDLELAGDALRSAKRLVRDYDLKSMEALTDIADRLLERAEKRYERFRRAEGRLASAEQTGVVSAIASAKVELAQLWMEAEGDLAKAAEYLSQTDDPRAKPLATAVAFAAGRRPGDEEILIAATVLTQWGESLTDLPKTKTCELAMVMCQHVGHASDDPALVGRARMILARLGQVGGMVADDAAAGQLAAFKIKSGRVVLLSGGTVRANYDFAEEDQFGDWQVTGGAWKWDRQAIIAQGSGTPTVDSRLRFRADRPLTVSFTARAAKQIGTIIQLFDWKGAKVGEYAATFGAKKSGRQDRHTEGVVFQLFGESFKHTEQRLITGRPYAIVLELDGRGGYFWTINDSVVYSGRSEDPARTTGSLVVRLMTVSTANTTAATVDNIIIEGTLLPNPTWHPSE
jgi:hypothetical protein